MIYWLFISYDLLKQFTLKILPQNCLQMFPFSYNSRGIILLMHNTCRFITNVTVLYIGIWIYCALQWKMNFLSDVSRQADEIIFTQHAQQ